MIPLIIVFATIVFYTTACIRGWIDENVSLFVIIATIVCYISIIWLVVHMVTNFYKI